MRCLLSPRHGQAMQALQRSLHVMLVRCDAEKEVAILTAQQAKVSICHRRLVSGGAGQIVFGETALKRAHAHLAQAVFTGDLAQLWAIEGQPEAPFCIVSEILTALQSRDEALRTPGLLLTPATLPVVVKVVLGSGAAGGGAGPERSQVGDAKADSSVMKRISFSSIPSRSDTAAVRTYIQRRPELAVRVAASQSLVKELESVIRGHVAEVAKGGANPPAPAPPGPGAVEPVGGFAVHSDGGAASLAASWPHTQLRKAIAPCIAKVEDVHVLAGVLLQFLASLQVPLIPPLMVHAFFTAVVTRDAHAQIVALRAAVACLPPPHFHALRALVEFAALDVLHADNASENGVTLDVLSDVLGQVVLPPHTITQPQAATQLQGQGGEESQGGGPTPGGPPTTPGTKAARIAVTPALASSYASQLVGLLVQQYTTLFSGSNVQDLVTSAISLQSAQRALAASQAAHRAALAEIAAGEDARVMMSAVALQRLKLKRVMAAWHAQASVGRGRAALHSRVRVLTDLATELAGEVEEQALLIERLRGQLEEAGIVGALRGGATVTGAAPPPVPHERVQAALEAQQRPTTPQTEHGSPGTAHSAMDLTSPSHTRAAARAAQLFAEGAPGSLVAQAMPPAPAHSVSSGGYRVPAQYSQ